MAGSKNGPNARTPKRSDRVYLTTMAGAGAAALGIYALAPNSACPEGRLYPSLEQCLRDGKLDAALCRDGFEGRRDPVLFRGPGGGQSFAAVDAGGGMLRLSDGSLADGGSVCRTSDRSSGSSGSRGSSRSSFFGSGDNSSSSQSSSHASGSGGDGGGAVSHGGFGGTGHAMSGHTMSWGG